MNKNKNMINLLVLALVTILLSTSAYLQNKKIERLEAKVIELEKTVVKKDAVIESVAEQIGDELSEFYKKIIKYN